MSISKSQLSLAGEFAVLSRLALLGYDANLTLGTAKGVDILVADPNSNNMFKVEVKTSPWKEAKEKFIGDGKFMYWIMGAKHAATQDPKLFYCMVAVQEDMSFRFFVVPSAIISEYIRAEYPKYLAFNPHLTPKDAHFRKFRLAIDAQSNYLFNQPDVKQYEDNWDLLKKS